VFWKNPIYADPRLNGLQDILTWQAQHSARIRPQTVGGAEFTQLVSAAIADITNGADAKKTLDTTNAKLNAAWRKYQ